MSLRQAYSLALTAQDRLTKETNRPDRNLRIIVGHLRHYESLRLHIQDIERDRASRRSSRRDLYQEYLEFAHDASPGDEHHDADDEDADATASEEEYDDDDYDEEMYYDDDADDSELSLSRCPSNSGFVAPPPSYSSSLSLSSSAPHQDHHNPPDLLHDHDDSSSDDSEGIHSPLSSGPPSPTFAPSHHEVIPDDVAMLSSLYASHSLSSSHEEVKLSATASVTVVAVELPLTSTAPAVAPSLPTLGEVQVC